MNPYISQTAENLQLRRQGSRWTGSCPECGGSARTDRFSLYESGGFRCYSCGYKGDAVRLLRSHAGMNCKQAHEALSLPCSSECRYHGECGKGKEKNRPLLRIKSPQPPPAAKSQSVASTTPVLVNHAWQAWASDLLATAQEALRQQSAELAWLAKRGVPEAATRRYGLGWLDHDHQVKRAALCLPPHPEKEKLWVPGGLLIPVFDQQGGLCQLRVRRPEAARKRFLPKRKYHQIEGGANDPLVLGPPARHRGVLVVEAELDAMACAFAQADVLVIALKSVANGLPSWLRQICADAPVVLVALDADQRREGGKPGAGPEAVKRWLATFKKARFWPVPMGKDPGEYVEAHQGDLAAWISAGLPPFVAPDHDQPSYPACSLEQGGGGVKQTEQADEPSGPQHYILTLDSGEEVHVTDSRELWQELVDEGLLVFSAGELQRLQIACKGMNDAERQVALQQVLAAKSAFSGGYIVAGRGGGT